MPRWRRKISFAEAIGPVALILLLVVRQAREYTIRKSGVMSWKWKP